MAGRSKRIHAPSGPTAGALCCRVNPQGAGGAGAEVELELGKYQDGDACRILSLFSPPGIACLCCDARRQVRMQALTYLQRALLVHDLQKLDALEWESCFNKVGLFSSLKGKFISLRLGDPGSLKSP